MYAYEILTPQARHKACDASVHPEEGVVDVQGVEFQAKILK